MSNWSLVIVNWSTADHAQGDAKRVMTIAASIGCPYVYVPGSQSGGAFGGESLGMAFEAAVVMHINHFPTMLAPDNPDDPAYGVLRRCLEAMPWDMPHEVAVLWKDQESDWSVVYPLRASGQA